MRVLIVEDDPGIVSFLEKGFASEGYVPAANRSINSSSRRPSFVGS